MVILMEPDIVLMERRSYSWKVPIMLLDTSLMTVERDIMEDWTSDYWTAIDGYAFSLE